MLADRDAVVGPVNGAVGVYRVTAETQHIIKRD